MGGNAAEIVVVGGGVTGAFAAYFLARMGARPTIVEPDGIGEHASGNNPGGLNPLHGAGIPGPLQTLALDSFRLHVGHRDALRELSGVNCSARPVRKVHLAMEEADISHLERAKDAHDDSEGFAAEWMEPDDILAFEPRVNPAVVRGLCTEGNAKVDSRPYTQTVARAAIRLGARVAIDRVRGVRRSGARVTHVALNSGSIGCDGVVVATGPWTAEPARWLETPIPIEPVKGQLLQVRGQRVQCDFAWRDAAIYGRGQGDELLLGGTEEHTGFDLAPTPTRRASLLERLSRVFPRIREASVLKEIAGLRAATPDGLPILGLARGWDNVCLALGAGRKGMLLSAGMGKSAAELLATGSTGLSITACSPERWAPRPNTGAAGS